MVANAYASHSRVLSYSEPKGLGELFAGLPEDAVALSRDEKKRESEAVFERRKKGSMSEEEVVEMIRVFVGGRALAAYDMVARLEDKALENVQDDEARAIPLVMKLSSSFSSRIAVLRAAFPSMKWAFLYRRALEVMVSSLVNREVLQKVIDEQIDGEKQPPFYLFLFSFLRFTLSESSFVLRKELA